MLLYTWDFKLQLLHTCETLEISWGKKSAMSPYRVYDLTSLLTPPCREALLTKCNVSEPCYLCLAFSFFLARCCLSSTLLLFVPGGFWETAVGLSAGCVWSGVWDGFIWQSLPDVPQNHHLSPQHPEMSTKGVREMHKMTGCWLPHPPEQNRGLYGNESALISYGRQEKNVRGIKARLCRH